MSSLKISNKIEWPISFFAKSAILNYLQMESAMLSFVRSRLFSLLLLAFSLQLLLFFWP